MLILIDPGDVGLQNLGDVAMLQTALDRLLALWPFSDLFVLTSDAISLARHCPGARPVSDEARRSWLSEQLFLGRLHGRLPAPMRRAIGGATRFLRRVWPGVVEARIHLRIRPGSREARELDEFLGVLRRAQLIVTAGQGTINDTFEAHARLVLSTVESAESLHKPTAMFGQGIGPVTSPGLARQAARVLKRVDLVTLREKRLGPALLGRFGVDPAHVRVTGDDAVEMAFALRSDRLGANLGLNLRTGRRSGIDRSMIDPLRGALTAFTRARNAGIVALPIAVDPEHGDMQAIGEALGPEALATAMRSTVESPREAICATAGCRIVVTAAYHAAVFALSQGISALCLAGSEYYLDKFLGLRDLFGEGCRVLSLKGPEGSEAFPALLQESWDRADVLRVPLLEAAERQVQSSREAYEHLGRLLVRNGRAA